MKILQHGMLLCLVALSNTAPAPKRQGVDIEKTVAQVEEVLRQNTNLPRLSRDDILQLLNDIRAEDERSASASSERSNENIFTDEREKERIEFNEINDEERTDLSPAASSPPKVTKPPPQSERLMVVLPYTPKDAASLQELYTRPPRVALLRAPAPMKAPDALRQASNEVSVPQTVQPLKPVVKTTKEVNASVKPTVASKQSELKETKPTLKPIVAVVKPELPHNISTKVPVPVEYPDVAADLREFLDSHGIKGNAGSPEDHFFLPLDGFKPLPPIRDVDGSVELPEKILLTYDLASPHVDDLYSGPLHSDYDSFHLPPDVIEYNPLRPDSFYELGLPTELKETVLPLDSPSRKRKAVDGKTPYYNPVEYESVKVIPLKVGPDPLALISGGNSVDVEKRQTANTTASPEISASEATSTEAASTAATDSVAVTPTSAPKNAESSTSAERDSNDSASADSSDAGPSIVDLENSFGAPAPMDPSESELPPPRKNGFYWMLDWNSFLEVGDGDEKVNIRFEPKLGDPQMFLPVSVP